MKSISKIAALCLLLLSPPLAADMLPILEIQLVARQAPFIVKGTVLADGRLKVETQHKGELPDDTIAVPELSTFSDYVKNQMTDENDLAVFLLRAKLSDETCARFKAHGLVGSTVLLLLLDQPDDAGTYALKGTMLDDPDVNHKHVAIKVLAENVVFRFGRMRTGAPVQLLLDRDNPTPDELDAAVRYDRTFLLRLGYSPPSPDGTTGNYISLTLTNLSNEPVQIDLEKNMLLSVSAAGAAGIMTLPNDPWATLPDKLEPGERRFLTYYLKDLDPQVFQFQHAKQYDLILTIRLTKDGKEERFTATKTAKIP